jgi:hypothetical protein
MRISSPIACRALLLLALTMSAVGPFGAGAQANAGVTVVASGLTNPRGFAFDATGRLFVALGGTTGASAGVVRIDAGCPAPIVGGLPAYRVVFGGPTGVAAVAFLDGQLYALLAGGDTDRGGMPNGLYRIDASGKVTLVANISAFIRDHPVADRPPDYDTDGQPYAMLAMGNAFWVTEGNSDQLLHVGLDGGISRVTDLSRGHPIPTGIAPAPNGGAYVAYFTHAPYRDGASSVLEVAPDGTVTPVWSNLTLVTALAAGPDGALYALEMATGIDAEDPSRIAPGTGKVVRRTGPQTSEDIVTGLTLPVAMDLGPDGALYVASPAFGADQGEGTIVRVDLGAGTPIDAALRATPAALCS